MPRQIGPNDDPYRQLETTLVKQLLQSSGAFRGSSISGSQLQTDMFVDALAEAVAKSGGFGVAKMLERELGPIKPEGKPEGEAALEGPGERPAPAGHDHRPRLTSNFGLRTDPIDGSQRFHVGVDLAGREGTPILAAAAGVVKRAGERGGYGNAVEIDHGGGVTTLYAHASELNVVPGEKVEPGQELGTVGATGRATGAHLHFEVRHDGRPVDPTRALKAYGIRADKTIGGNR
jgi:murein DD-endopeptidase MepM/ murein hydrolase activator NlpD